MSDSELRKKIHAMAVRYGEDYDGEAGLLYLPEQHAKRFTDAIMQLLAQAQEETNSKLMTAIETRANYVADCMRPIPGKRPAARTEIGQRYVDGLWWTYDQMAQLHPKESGKQESDGDFYLMQHTGLHDKNGREIYEGDIVRVGYRGEEKRMNTVGWVDYQSPRFIVRTKSDTEIYLCLYAYNESALFNWTESEVIGNIHENPELLK